MKVGDYVRAEISSLNIQRIGKIKEIISEDFIHTDIGTYDKEYIIKSSPRIIDLIQVGDYVNGYRVIDFDYSVANTRIRIWIDTENEINYIFKNDIKSIVTHEQFSQMEYRIGE